MSVCVVIESVKCESKRNEWMEKGSKVWSIYIGKWREKNGLVREWEQWQRKRNMVDALWQFRGWLDSGIKLKLILKSEFGLFFIIIILHNLSFSSRLPAA